jgi:hypothetical protein
MRRTRNSQSFGKFGKMRGATWMFRHSNNSGGKWVPLPEHEEG